MSQTVKGEVEVGARILGGAVQEKIVSIPPPEDPQQAYQCPACHNRTVLVEGSFLREFEEEIEDGQSLGQEVAGTITKNITGVHCSACQTLYVYEPGIVLELRQRLMETKMELAGYQGLLVLEPASQKVN